MTFRATIPVLLTLALGLFIVVPYSMRVAKPEHQQQAFVISMPNKPDTVSAISSAEVLIDRSMYCVNLLMHEPSGSRITFVVKDKSFEPGLVSLDHPRLRYGYFTQQKNVFKSDDYYTGNLEIISVDSVRKTMRGRFDFVGVSGKNELAQIRKAHFDVPFVVLN